MTMMILNQSHNQVMMNNGGYGCGAYATCHPAVNISSFRMHNNNWKMNKRNVNSINNVNNKSNLKEMQQQNRLKPRRFTKKKYTKSSAPLAPRNTTSYLIRAKKSGGLSSIVSPCAVTPSVLPTPVFSPSSEVLGDMAKEEWGVDGYGSMNGLIRLRNDEEDEADGVIDVERFEMVYPSNGGERSSLENRVDDQVSHIAILEEENLVLKERLFYMEKAFGDLRTRLESLEVKKHNDCGSKDNDNSGRKMDNNDENECSVHNDDHKMEDDDNATVGAKDRKLNELLVNIPSGNNMDNNDENECSVHNESHKMEDEDQMIVEAKDRKSNEMLVNADSSDLSRRH